MLFLSGFYTPSVAQYTYFPDKGTVVYEKKINVHAFIRKSREMKHFNFQGDAFSGTPQFSTSKYILAFDGAVSLYTPEKAEQIYIYSHDISPEIDATNTVYAWPDRGRATVRKRFMMEDFLIKEDTLRQINWKITDETRDILGYTCRRANALIMDSVYVVAFYTDEIPFRGGPESFTGLPGMILGVALPHHHITWFATEIKQGTAPAVPIVAPTAGKPQTRSGLREYLNKNLRIYNKNFLKRVINGIML
ncbi:GLPGLI family protein [Arcticibacter tournemirensis]|uniref:GLPGLI family protein n=2 Tax=Arcticibacter tournemirensis TaxID=699437 RepID=A0A4V1KI57_9SPHI|nr:GLPGLI family protein [Arcticibacter tournemirensis]